MYDYITIACQNLPNVAELAWKRVKLRGFLALSVSEQQELLTTLKQVRLKKLAIMLEHTFNIDQKVQDTLQKHYNVVMFDSYPQKLADVIALHDLKAQLPDRHGLSVTMSYTQWQDWQTTFDFMDTSHAFDRLVIEAVPNSQAMAQLLPVMSHANGLGIWMEIAQWDYKQVPEDFWLHFQTYLHERFTQQSNEAEK